MIIADSIGFAATHTISRILEEIPGADVSHGSRNFIEKGPIGDSDMSLKEFLSAMKNSEANGNRAYAVHALYPPPEARALSKMMRGQHKVIVREPIRQIRSCYAWLVKRALDGNEGAQPQLVAAARQILAKSPVPNTLPNAFFAFAVNHVMDFTVAALNARCEIIQMERLVTEEDYFRAAFDVPAEAELSHFSGRPIHESSHRNKASDLGAGQPDEEPVIDLFKWTVGQEQFDLKGIGSKLSYS